MKDLIASPVMHYISGKKLYNMVFKQLVNYAGKFIFFVKSPQAFTNINQWVNNYLGTTVSK